MDRILIAGMGVVGRNLLSKGLGGLDADTYDPRYPQLPTCKHSEYDFIFICVDTPYIDKYNPCYINDIESVINKWSPSLSKDGLFVIKSTVLPEYCDRFKNYRVVFSPEYYGNTFHCNNFDFDFTILGGEYNDCIKVQQLLQKCYDARHKFRIVSAKTACLAKYMENCYLAMKVSFCSQFYKIAENNQVPYEELRELFILDPRVNPSHTFIDRDEPYWDSHCLNKDVRAIAESEDAKLLKSIIEFNESMKNKD